MNSSRPYLVRALYEWIVDNDCTPHLLVNAEFPGVRVPPGYANDGQIVLNVSPVFDARGEAMVPDAVRTAFALPPMVRIVLRRSVLGPSIRAQIDRAPVDLSLEGDPC